MAAWWWLKKSKKRLEKKSNSKKKKRIQSSATSLLTLTNSHLRGQGPPEVGRQQEPEQSVLRLRCGTSGTTARLSVRPARKKMVEILGDPAVQGCRVRAVRTDVPPATRAGIGVAGGFMWRE